MTKFKAGSTDLEMLNDMVVKLLEHTEEAKESMREHITNCARIDPDRYKKYYRWKEIKEI